MQRASGGLLGATAHLRAAAAGSLRAPSSHAGAVGPLRLLRALGTETPSHKPPPGAARREEASNITVADILAAKGSEKKYTTNPESTVFAAVQAMVERNIGSLVVVEPSTDKPVGIITERDYLEKVAVLGRTSKNTAVRDIMSTKDLVWVAPSATLNYCMNLMMEYSVRHIPVVEHGALRGLISVGDIVSELVDAHKRANDAMRDYIGGSY